MPPVTVQRPTPLVNEQAEAEVLRPETPLPDSSIEVAPGPVQDVLGETTETTQNLLCWFESVTVAMMVVLARVDE